MPDQKQSKAIPTDEELMQRIQRGQESAFNALYDRYSQRMYRYFYRMLGQSAEMAHDFTQELFLKIIEQPEAFDTQRRFSTWFYAVAGNLVKNEYRRKAKQPLQAPLEEANTASASIGALPDLDAEVRKAYIEKAVQALRPHHRECFLLRYQEGLAVQEISEIVDCPPGTVKSRLHYSLKKLNELLSCVLGPNA
ncbi:MAG: sigma-70 family RNA polymerase sigma factor [bacterium]|jgi:RNA polymerase sigma-70 factor (ECF subfamily)|nr:sigma-70 family RNA polymerase sigma factor [bacterium]